jgi:peptide/nickel transport system substrate-binding protein
MAFLEGLVRPANNEEGYELVLAESIEPSEDYSSFTVTLREGVNWSDGTPLTAGDVKTLFDTYVFSEGSTLSGNVASIESTDAPDDRTVVFNLSTPQAPFPVNLANIPIYKPVEGLEQTSIPIGTGPFTLDTWEPGVRTVLKKNPGYWGTDADGVQLPYLDQIDVVAIASGDTRLNSIESGDVDIAMSTDAITSAAMEERSTAYSVELNAGDGLFFNASSAPTDDVRVRRGLAYATDKEAMLAAVGGGDPRVGHFVEASDWYTPEAAEATPGYDQDAARELLDEYINDPARSDGLPVGTPLAIDITVLQGAITAESFGAVAQQQWGDVGVEVTVTPKDQSTLIGDAISGNFNVNYFAWATPHPYSLLVRNYGPWPETPSNYTHFNSEELFGIVDEMATADSEQMDALIDEANMVIADGVPIVFLVSTPLVWGTTDVIGNIDLLPGNGMVEWSTVARAQ